MHLTFYYKNIIILMKVYVKYMIYMATISILYDYGASAMNISYDYYRVFYYVAKYGNVTRAAKLLLNNQPNLTRTIKILESELGCALFSRSNRGMKLTPEGKRLYEHVRIAFKQIELGQSEIAECKSLKTGMVYVAASEVALRCFLLPILNQYRLEYPGIHLQISNHSTPQAVAALKNGTADLAVVTTPSVELVSLAETTVCPIHEVAVCSLYFDELTKGPVSVRQLGDYPLISLGKDTKSFEFYSAFFADHGVAYRPDIEAFTADQILPMVEADLGIGFVPEGFLKGKNNVLKINLQEKIPSRSVIMLKRKDQPLSVAAKKLEQMIKENKQE